MQINPNLSAQLAQLKNAPSAERNKVVSVVFNGKTCELKLFERAAAESCLSLLKKAVTGQLAKVIKSHPNAAVRINHLAAATAKGKVGQGSPLSAQLPPVNADYGADAGLGLVGSLYPSNHERQALRQTRQLLLGQGMQLSSGKTGLVTVGEILDSPTLNSPAQLTQQAERELRAAWCERALFGVGPWQPGKYMTGNEDGYWQIKEYMNHGKDAHAMLPHLQELISAIGGQPEVPRALIEARALQLANQLSGILRPDQKTLEQNRLLIQQLLSNCEPQDINLMDHMANAARLDDTPVIRTARQAVALWVERQMSQ